MTDPWQAAWRSEERRETDRARAERDAADRRRADEPLLAVGARRLREIGQRAALELDQAGVPQPPIWSWSGYFRGTWKRTAGPPGVWGLRIRGLTCFAASGAGLFGTNAMLVSTGDHLQGPYTWKGSRGFMTAPELCWAQYESDQPLRSPLELRLSPARIAWVDPPTQIISDLNQCGLTVTSEGEPVWWQLGNMGPAQRERFEDLVAAEVVRQITRHRGRI